MKKCKTRYPLVRSQILQELDFVQVTEMISNSWKPPSIFRFPALWRLLRIENNPISRDKSKVHISAEAVLQSMLPSSSILVVSSWRELLPLGKAARKAVRAGNWARKGGSCCPRMHFVACGCAGSSPSTDAGLPLPLGRAGMPPLPSSLVSTQKTQALHDCAQEPHWPNTLSTTYSNLQLAGIFCWLHSL